MHPLGKLLRDAADGRFPPPAGSLVVLGPPPGPVQAVVAFTAHTVIAADVRPEEVAGRIPTEDIGAPMSATFLTWLGERLGARPGMLDVVLVHSGDHGVESNLDLIPRHDLLDHPRVRRAHRLRDEVTVYSDAGRRGVVILGRGLARRLEISVEIDPAHRGRGLGRAMVAAGRALAPPAEPVFAQIAPGNAASLRAFLALGFRPIGSEVLFLGRPR